MEGEAATAKEDAYVFTNNDHVLNGLRLAINSDEPAISAADVLITFFAASKPPRCITIDRNGSLSDWPDGCFDAMERALMKLLTRP